MVDLYFLNDTATTEIYTLSLHDALPISPLRPERPRRPVRQLRQQRQALRRPVHAGGGQAPALPDDRRELLQGDLDRKSTRLNSSHANISYAVFCLKKLIIVFRSLSLNAA